MQIEIHIHNGTRMLSPPVEPGISWTTERRGMPGKLVFSAIQDELLEIGEGNPVSLHADGAAVFSGFIFKISRTQDGRAKITAYDQLRYLKNKDTYSFQASTASERIGMIARDYGIRTGEIADTGHTLPERVEEDSTLIDMMQTALDDTLAQTRQMYILYDEAGALTLKNAADMHIGLLVDAAGAQGYSYDSSIDDESYNRIKLVQTGKDGGIKKIFVSEDDANQKKWGTLQRFETIDDDENAQNRAEMLLALYNAPVKSLRISGALGDLRVRAGCFVIVRMQLADAEINGFMLVEKCAHSFNDGLHTMDLTLRGGDFHG